MFVLLLIPAFAIAAERPGSWAVPVAAPGLENFNKVTGNLYRSGQPGTEGYRELQRRGVKTVINLRDNHDDKDEARGTKLRLVRVEMDSWDIEDRDVARVLAMLRRKEDGPFLVHCWHGSDRTGVICAMYRMVEQRWSREEAIHELRDGGYGFHRVWKNIIRYLEGVDLEKVRRRVDRLAAAGAP
jgi:protein tyrosine/serine phosphatase